MSKESIFKDLVAEMAKDGDISSSEYAILIEKGEDLGLSKESVDLLIELELSNSSEENYEESYNDDYDDSSYTSKHKSSFFGNDNDSDNYSNNREYTFKSAITRGGNVITPDIIIIDSDTVTYKKRNKYLINVDSIVIPIKQITSVELDTSLLGTDIIIRTFGSGQIIGRKFTKSDAKEIRNLIYERQS